MASQHSNKKKITEHNDVIQGPAIKSREIKLPNSQKVSHVQKMGL